MRSPADSEEEDVASELLNDPELFIAELNLDAEPRKLPEINEAARYFEKQTQQKRYYRKCAEEGRVEELDALDSINALKLHMNCPLFSQMCAHQEAAGPLQPRPLLRRRLLDAEPRKIVQHQGVLEA